MNKRMISATRASSKTVLLIHPDNDYSQALKQLLVLHQFRVIHERTASEGIYRVLKGEVDVTIMNAALPDVDGYHACRLIRMYNGWTPILLLTQHVTDADEIRGLDAGANDYIGKATGNAVLLARLRAMLRIHEEKGEIGDYRLSHSSMILRDDQKKKIRLTEIEVKLLKRLFQSRGKTVSRLELIASVWGSKNSVSGHGLESHVYRLRQKIEPKPHRPFWLFTSIEGYGLRCQSDHYKRKHAVASD